MIDPESAQKWLDADLEAAGFLPGEASRLRGMALQQLARQDPAAVIARMGEEDFPSDQRRNILSALFSSGNADQLRPLLNQLASEEDRQFGSQRLDQLGSPHEEWVSATGPADLLAKLDPADPRGNDLYFSQLQEWDQAQLAALAAEFKALPADRKEHAAKAIYNQTYAGSPALRGEALRYLIENPGTFPNAPREGSRSLTARSSEYAASLVRDDPAAASAWVESLPAGDAQAWARKNLLRNWRQYDPKAAAAWEAKLPAADREAMGRLKP